MSNKPNPQLLLSLLLNKDLASIATNPKFIEFYRVFGLQDIMDHRTNSYLEEAIIDYMTREVWHRRVSRDEGLDYARNLENKIWDNLRYQTTGIIYGRDPIEGLGKSIVQLWSSQPFRQAVQHKDSVNALIAVEKSLKKLETLNKFKERFIKKEGQTIATESMAETRARQVMSDIKPTAKQTYEARMVKLSKEALTSIYRLLGTQKGKITSNDNRLVYKVSKSFLHPQILRKFPELTEKASSEAGLAPYSHWETNAVKEMWGSEANFLKQTRKWGVLQRAKWGMKRKPKAKRLLAGI